VRFGPSQADDLQTGPRDMPCDCDACGGACPVGNDIYRAGRGWRADVPVV